MKITINPEDYAISVADEQVPGADDTHEIWRNVYDEIYNSVTDFAILPPKPIRLLGSIPFCKEVGIDVGAFIEAYYQLDLNIQEGRDDMYGNNTFKFTPLMSKDGAQLDIAINSLHPCLIKMIFAYLQKPELIDKALELIANYEKD